MLNTRLIAVLVALAFTTLSLTGCPVEPEPVAVTGVTLNKTALTLPVGKTQALIAYVVPGDATNKNVSWSSSDEEIAVVSASGLVTAVAEGTATITVTTADGEYTTECTVDVDNRPLGTWVSAKGAYQPHVLTISKDTIRIEDDAGNFIQYDEVEWGNVTANTNAEYSASHPNGYTFTGTRTDDNYSGINFAFIALATDFTSVYVGTDVSTEFDLDDSGSIFILSDTVAPAPGNTLAQKLAWVLNGNNVENGASYLIEVNRDEAIAAHTLTYTNRSNITITLKGSGEERIVSLSSSSDGSLFTVANGVTLILDRNITLQGKSNYAELVRVNSGGTFEMRSGAKITGNDNSFIGSGGVYVDGGATFTMEGGEISGNISGNISGYAGYGGGVYVGGNATFTMNGGEISGNNTGTTRYPGHGGGVYMDSNATFTMNGGEISGNTIGRDGYGGGVYMGSNTTFTMNGGEISGNTIGLSGLGGGMYVGRNATFTMTGGEISDNHSSLGGGLYVSGTFTMTGGEISDNTGGGVYVYYGATFTMNNGTISGNTTRGGGGGVHADTFTMTGGEIFGNTSLQGGGLYVSGTFTMTGGKISGNTATNNGGGVSAGTFTMTGGEISGNTGGGVSAGTFTMTGGEISGNTDGGVVSAGTFTMEGGKITGNTSDYEGGGVSAGTLTMTGGEISGNTANDGGGVYMYGSNVASTMTGGKISGNTATNNGGGVYVSEDAAFTMTGGEITDNTANDGGGVYVYYGYGAAFTMEGGEISGNTATNDGGGVCVYYGATFTMTGGEISGNTASSNGGGVCIGGGGTTVDGVRTTFMMNGGEISGNTASSNGGGVYIGGGTAYKIFYIVTGTIYGSNAAEGLRNTATDGGAALYIESSYGNYYYGIYNNNNFEIKGLLETTDNTVRVVNGELQ